MAGAPASWKGWQAHLQAGQGGRRSEDGGGHARCGGGGGKRDGSEIKVLGHDDVPHSARHGLDERAGRCRLREEARVIIAACRGCVVC